MYHGAFEHETEEFLLSLWDQAAVICIKMAAILNLCKLTTFPVSKSCRLFICSSEGPNKQVKAKKPITIYSRLNPIVTGLFSKIIF